MSDWFISAGIWFNYVVFVYFLITNIQYLLLFLASIGVVSRHLNVLRTASLDELLEFHLLPPLSILAPAYNEEATIVQSIRSLLNLHYETYEVIVINDGSKDGTLERLKEAFELEPASLAPEGDLPTKPVRRYYTSRQRHVARLVVVDKENGGKADALNAGINVAEYPLFCAMDADSVLEGDALLRVVKPFIDAPETVAIGGIIRLANGSSFQHGKIQDVRLPAESIARYQIVEYLRAFLFGRSAWSQMNALLIISGAFGVFRRDIVQTVGGYRTDTVGEDMELVVRLHRWFRERRQPYRIGFVSDPVCWTEAPDNYAILAKQRNRWYRGLSETLWRHRAMCLNPRYGVVGMVAFPLFVLTEWCGPIIEGAGYIFFVVWWWFGWLDQTFAMMFLAMSLAFGVFLSTGAVLLEELTYRRYPRWQDWLIMLAYGVLENFGYRQRHVFWRLRGLWDLMRGRKQWGDMVRSGFTASTGGTP
jgi:cellulose synthase/poly-beta-1,6-N-acetylglucosamine synthase-like glycosyltransferase